jgi:hypothetical protein
LYYIYIHVCIIYCWIQGFMTYSQHDVFGWMLVSPNPMSLGMHLHLDETRTRCTLSSRLKSLVTKESLNLSHMVDNSTTPSHGHVLDIHYHMCIHIYTYPYTYTYTYT